MPAENRTARLRHRCPNRDDSLALPLQCLAVGDDETGAGDRVEVHRPADVLEPERSERRHLDARLVLDLLVCGVGQEHGAADGERLDPRREVDGIAGQSLRLDDDVADVDPDADRNVGWSELALHRHCGPDRGECAREHRKTPVAETLDDRPSG